MAYWWVNHKQTYTSEIEGGYIWSPKTKKNGNENQTYINLTLTNPGDIVVSYANTKIKAIGVVTSSCRKEQKPSEFGTAGDGWSNTGWAVPIEWKILTTPITPRQHIDQIRPLLPPLHSPIQANGNGNQGCYLASISEELGSLLLQIAYPNNKDSLESIELDQIEIEELKVVEAVTAENIESTEKEQIIKARKGQGKFRQNLEKLEPGCRVTGVKVKNLLIASHIKPWRVANNSERLDGNNGLLLAPHIDKLFDRGWISFHADGELTCANDEVEGVLQQWGVQLPLNVGIFTKEQTVYLRYHQEEVYIMTPVSKV